MTYIDYNSAQSTARSAATILADGGSVSDMGFQRDSVDPDLFRHFTKDFSFCADTFKRQVTATLNCEPSYAATDSALETWSFTAQF